MKRYLGWLGMTLLLAMSAVQAGPLLDEIQVQDTCRTTYADKLASCTPFRCVKPNPMAMAFGSPPAEALAKMPPTQQQKMRETMAAAEKKLEDKTPEERAAMKAKMTSVLEIKGLDAQGRCQTVTWAIPSQRMDCAWQPSMLPWVAEHTRLAANAEHIQVKSESHLENGKMVTTQMDTIDGKTVANPWAEALKQGRCTVAEGVEVASPAMPSQPATPPPAESRQTANTLFILDASGSMWAQIGGKPKITIAKEVMEKLVAEFPAGNRIGLIAYGHRRKADCNDVETLVRLGENNQQTVLDAVKGLNANGKTPLTRSANQAIDMLRGETGPSTVVLVSDGIESCGADPCAAVKAAKASGVNFILHTVGFGLSKQDSSQLQCMAKAGGGEYFQADNAEELLKSARSAVKSKGPGLLQLTLLANGKPVNAWVRLTGDDATGAAALTNDEGVEPGHGWRLAPGTYRLETYPAGLRGVEPMVLKGIRIESGKTVEKRLDFAQATLHLIATLNGKPAIVQIQLTHPNTGKVVFATATFSTFTMNGVNTPYDVHVPPGRYHLSIKPNDQGAAYEEDIALAAGGDAVEKRVNFDRGELRVLVTLDGKAVPAEITIASKATQRKVFETLPYVGSETPLSVMLAPGLYQLAAVPAGIAGLTPKILEDVEVNATGPNELSVPFTTPTSATDATGMEQNTDRPFGDYQRLTLAHDNAALCQQACLADVRCKAWTYVKPNTVQGPEPLCYLKENVPQASPNTCCTSGVTK